MNYNKLNQITYGKSYIITGLIVRVFCLFFGVVKNNLGIFILGIAVIGIQIIKIRSMRKEWLT